MKDKLVLNEGGNRNGWVLQWYIAEEDDMGAEVGEELSGLPERDWFKVLKTMEERDRKMGIDGIEGILATRAVMAMVDPDREMNGGFVWQSKSKAAKALKVAREAIKQARTGKTLPAWATEALANGWKPPKGWKP